MSIRIRTRGPHFLHSFTHPAFPLRPWVGLSSILFLPIAECCNKGASLLARLLLPWVKLQPEMMRATFVGAFYGPFFAPFLAAFKIAHQAHQ